MRDYKHMKPQHDEPTALEIIGASLAFIGTLALIGAVLLLLSEF